MANSYHVPPGLIVVVLVFLASFAIPSDCYKHHHDLQARRNQLLAPALFVFGDSLFDAGINNYINTTGDFKANFPPYGDSFFKYPSGRWCDGRVIPDFIAEYANLPLIQPYLQIGNQYELAFGTNFASAGAGALAETFSGFVIDLKKQLWYFNEAEQLLKRNLGARLARRVVYNSVFLFSIGNNDYYTAFSPNSTIFKSYTPQEYASMVVRNISYVFEEIYKKGGRKFGILNLGAIGCVPSSRAASAAGGGNGACAEEITEMAKLHNVLLSQQLQQLHKDLKGFKYSFFDFFAAGVDVLEYPSKYGLKEVKSACCGGGPFRGAVRCGEEGYELCNNPQEHLFFDSGHLSEATNERVAELMWAGPSNITGPYNLQSFFQIAY